MTNLVLTVIGDDRPGLVSALAAAVAEAGGNWLDSQMAHMSGKFAGIVLVETEDEAALRKSLPGVDGLEIAVTVDESTGEHVEGATYALSVVGTDRPGIVRAFSAALADAGATIEHLSTITREGPWGAGILFEADASVRLPEGVELQQIREALEAIADDLVVDIDAETEPEA